MKKILSILVPTYNMEKYLRRCLNSLILEEEYLQYLDVLIVNDGSKDSSSQIAHEYESRFPTVFRVLDKENGNYGSCINRGLPECKGKYVKVLDADDYFDTQVFYLYLRFLKTTNIDLIFTDYSTVNDQGIVKSRKSFKYPHLMTCKVDEVCCDKSFLTVEMHAVTYKREKLISNCYKQTEGVSYTDQEWVFLPITYMDTFCYFRESLYQYLVGREGQTVDMSVSAKQINVHKGLLFKRIEIYRSLISKNNVSHKKLQYLKQRLIYKVSLIFHFGIIFDSFPKQDLMNFDRELKEFDKELYDDLENAPLLSYHNLKFLSYWRKHGELPFSIKVIRWISKVIKELKKH